VIKTAISFKIFLKLMVGSATANA